MTDETLTVEIPLDDAHAEMVAQLRDAGFDVEAIARRAAAPAVDQAVHEAFLSSKYEE